MFYRFSAENLVYIDKTNVYIKGRAIPFGAIVKMRVVGKTVVIKTMKGSIIRQGFLSDPNECARHIKKAMECNELMQVE